MPKYVIQAVYLYSSKYLVEAHSKEEALRLFAEDGGDHISDSFVDIEDKELDGYLNKYYPAKIIKEL